MVMEIVFREGNPLEMGQSRKVWGKSWEDGALKLEG